MIDPRIPTMLDLMLRDTTLAPEREAARLAVNRILNRRSGCISDVLNPGAGSGGHSRIMGLVSRLTADNARLTSENAALRDRLQELTKASGTEALLAWAEAGGKGDLPPPRDGHYPFVVLKVVCQRRLGTGPGWQAALAVAITAETGIEFRSGGVQDWHRSRKGVPEEFVRIAHLSPHLARPAPHKWTRAERADVEARIVEGWDDREIMAELSGKGVEVTTEAVRAIRKALVARQKKAA